eukprot:4385264-Pyramimonas_sp.AAC.1
MAMPSLGARRRSLKTRGPTQTDGSRWAAPNAKYPLKSTNRRDRILIETPRPVPTYITIAAAPPRTINIDEDAFKDFQA